MMIIVPVGGARDHLGRDLLAVRARFLTGSRGSDNVGYRITSGEEMP